MDKNPNKHTPEKPEEDQIRPTADAIIDEARKHTVPIEDLLAGLALNLSDAAQEIDQHRAVHESDLEALKGMDMTGSDEDSEEEYGIDLNLLSPEVRTAFLEHRARHQQHIQRYLPSQRRANE